MNRRRKLNDAAFQRSFLMISAGVVITLLLINNLVPRRTPPEYQTKTPSRPSAQLSQNSGEKQATPTPTTGSLAATQVLAVQEKNCVYTEEYWRTHPQAWLTDNIIIGQFSFSKQAGLTIINMVTEDLSTLLQKQFLVAALNILTGADPAPIEGALNEASQWIDVHPPGVEMPTVARNQGILLAQRLTDYNQGLIGPILCLDQPPTSMATATRTPTATATPNVDANLSIPTVGNTPRTHRDGQGAPVPETPDTDVPTGTHVPSRQPAATQAPASTPTSAPAVPPEPTSTSQPPANGSGEPTEPPSPQPTDPPSQPTNPPPEATQAPEPTSAPPPPEVPTNVPPGESGATQPPDIAGILATIGAPLP